MVVKWLGGGLVGKYSQVRVLCSDIRVVFSEKESISHNPYQARSALN